MGAVLSDNVGSYVITSASKTITYNDSFNSITLILISGTVTVTGNLNSPALGASVAVTLLANIPYVITSANPIDNLIINATSGSVSVIVTN